MDFKRNFVMSQGGEVLRMNFTFREIRLKFVDVQFEDRPPSLDFETMAVAWNTKVFNECMTCTEDGDNGPSRDRYT
jgi:hypothetical protein